MGACGARAARARIGPPAIVPCHPERLPCLDFGCPTCIHKSFGIADADPPEGDCDPHRIRPTSSSRSRTPSWERAWKALAEGSPRPSWSPTLSWQPQPPPSTDSLPYRVQLCEEEEEGVAAPTEVDATFGNLMDEL